MILTQYIKNNFGSKRGLLRMCFAEAFRFAGCYRPFCKIDFKNVKRLVFVCNGNICRSPLGEAVAKLQGVDAISYGLDTRGGDCADPRAVAFGDSCKISFAHHKTRKISEYQPEPGDLLVGMEPRHTKQLQMRYGGIVPITLAGLWLKTPAAYLHDPYNTNVEFFNHCETLVVQAATTLADKVKAQQ